MEDLDVRLSFKITLYFLAVRLRYDSVPASGQSTDNQDCPVCTFVQSTSNSVLPGRGLMAVSVPPRLLLMLCEQGNLGIHPVYLDDNEGPHVERFSANYVGN